MPTISERDFLRITPYPMAIIKLPLGATNRANGMRQEASQDALGTAVYCALLAETDGGRQHGSLRHTKFEE